MRYIRTLIYVITIGLVFTGTVSPARAQEIIPWTPAQIIPLYTDIYPPILVADRDRTVHAFNSENLDDQRTAIFYRKWRLDQGWTAPVDIILPSPSIRFALQDVTLDESGKFHMTYYIGSESRGDMVYSWAWASEANKAQSWSYPVEIGLEAGPIVDAALIGGGKDRLDLVYTGQRDGMGVYEVHSLDGGKSWSTPTVVALNNDSNSSPLHIDVDYDDEGRLHVAWGVVGDSGIGQRVYYARRDVDGLAWSRPYQIASREGNDYGTDWPSIIDHDGQLILMYMDGTIPQGIPPTRWMRTSRDAGRTWTSPVQPFPLVGENGSAILLEDSNGTLHTILANRVGEPAVGGVWHASWLGNQWGEAELITSRFPEFADQAGSYRAVSNASRPNGVVSQGDVILSAWWHDMRDQPPAGYSYTRLNAPELPVAPLPAVTSTPIPSLDSTATVVTDEPVISTPEVTPMLVESQINPIAPPGQVINPTIVILIGTIPALLLTFIAVSMKRFYKRSER